MLKEPLKPVRRFSDAEVQAVIDQLRVEVRPIAIFIRETGCRVEEALSLQHWQVQLQSRLVVFTEETKSGKFRYVPLTDDAVGAVEALPRLSRCPYVFYNLHSKTRWYNVRKCWNQARDSANLNEVRMQDLRSHYAILLAENGADMHDIQQVLGHSSVSVTERHYAQFSPERSARRILRVLQGGKSEELTRNSASEATANG